MSGQRILDHAAARNAPRDTWLERGARAVVRARLAGLRDGRLRIVDAAGGFEAGEAGTPPVTIEVVHGAFHADILFEGSLGAARGYMDGRWRCDDLPALFALLVRNAGLVDGLEGGLATLGRLAARARHLVNRNSRDGSRRNIEAHYDLGNDLFALFLDESMTYSAAYFERPESSLEAAQTAKLDRLCRKLDLRPADHLLEIGTGWGSMAIHAAREYGCRVTTATISRRQFDLATGRVREAGLEDRVQVLLRDYRDLTGKYDKLVSIEMIEAVGHAFLPEYFAACARLLEDDGAMALQAIAMPDRRYAGYLKSTDFIQRWIFPGSCCPALTAMLGAVRDATDMRVAHVEDIAPHYARTLARWRERFMARLPEVRDLGYPERFARMWEYYLAYCEAGFAERYLGCLQIVLQRPGCRSTPLDRATHAAPVARAA